MTVSAFLKDHIAEAAKAYDVTVVANADNGEFLSRLDLMAQFHRAQIVRPISLRFDFLALLSLIRFFRQQKFDIVHSVSPKAGLIAMLAGWIARVPVRIHTFTGQVWVTKRGLKRWILRQVDRLLAALTTNALADSPSQRQFLLDQGVSKGTKIQVIGQGAICGVDGERFRPNDDARIEVRRKLGIAPTSKLVLFLGRLTADKGVTDLAKAFALVANRFPDTHLLFVGPDEQGLAPSLNAIGEACAGQMHFVGHTDEPEHYFAAADVFCLPSYREGFGMVILEAAASGVPSLASRIYGITDALIEGETGLMHAPGSSHEIAEKLVLLLQDETLRKSMGDRARVRALTCFSKEESSKALMAFYEKLVA